MFKSFHSRAPRHGSFPATCATCGKQTEVPFKPRGDRPIYCNSCFRHTKGVDDRGKSRPYGSRPFTPRTPETREHTSHAFTPIVDRSGFDERLARIEAKLGKIEQLLSQTRSSA
jgi:CxxC-x17-CxxC domain-containing protein